MAVYSSTYRNVIEALRQTIESHPAVKTFRVGPPSTIEMPTEDTPEIKYPYVHLVPMPATLDASNTVFDFDMIVMDLAKDKLGLEERTQSSMLEITRDIVAYFTRTTWEEFKFNMALPIVATPFVEEFQNSCAGWTSQIQIIAQTPLSNCENPVMGTPLARPTYTPIALGYGSSEYADWTLEPIDTAFCQWEYATPDYYSLADMYIQENTNIEVGSKIVNVNGRVEKNLNGIFTLDLNYIDTVAVPPMIPGYVMVTIVEGIITVITPFEDITPCAVPPPTYEALKYTNTTTRTLSNTNAAFVFETEASDPLWFTGGTFSNYYGQKIVAFDSIISFEGTMTYKVGFDPSLYQLAIYNKEQDLFFGMTDLPAIGGTVSIVSDIFQYLPAIENPFGEPTQELQYLTLYEKGTANPNPFPPARLTNPFTYNGTFTIKVNN